MADELTYAQYWKAVADYAKEITEEARKTGNDIEDVLSETIDGSEYVIYTGNAMRVLLHCGSGNEEAWNDSYETPPTLSNGPHGKSINWGAVAMCAMMADIREHANYDAAEPEETEPDDAA